MEFCARSFPPLYQVALQFIVAQTIKKRYIQQWYNFVHSVGS
jgi:hypothetical protein